MDHLYRPDLNDENRISPREGGESSLGNGAAIENACQQVYDVLRRLHATAAAAGPVVFQDDDPAGEFDRQHELLSQALDSLHCHQAFTREALKAKLDCFLQLEAWFGPADEWVTTLAVVLCKEALAVLAEPGDLAISRVRPGDVSSSWRLTLPKMFGRPDAKSGARRNGT